MIASFFFTLALLVAGDAPQVRPPAEESPSAASSFDEASPRAAGPTTAEITRARARVLARRPTVEEVQEAALRRAAVDPRITRRWLARARVAAVLPAVQGEIDVKRDLGWSLDQEAGAADQLQQDQGAGRSMRLRVTWDLDRLIFDPNELRAARAAVDMAQVREQILVRVTQLYFERLQHLLALELGDDAAPRERLALELRIRELEAILGGLTGLRFDADAPAEAR
ncbi:MAG: hypothetical protein R3B09_35485 [Nannocystaceae bacterium]